MVLTRGGDVTGEYDWRTFEPEYVETCMNCGLEENEHEPTRAGCVDFPLGFVFTPWEGE